MAGITKLSDNDQQVYDSYMKDMADHDPTSYKMLAGVDPSIGYNILKGEPDFVDVSKAIMGSQQPSTLDKVSGFANDVLEASKGMARTFTPNVIQDLMGSAAKAGAYVKDKLSSSTDPFISEVVAPLVPDSKTSVGAAMAGPILDGSLAAGGALLDGAKAMAGDFLTNPERGMLAQKLNPFPSTNPEVGPAESNYLNKAAKVQDHFGPLMDPTSAGTELHKMVTDASQMSASQAQVPYDILKGMAMQTNAEGTPDALAKAAGEAGFSLRNIPALQESKIARLVGNMNAIETKAGNADAAGSAINPEGGASQGDPVRTLKFSELLDARNKLSAFANGQNGAVGTSMPGLSGQTSNQGRLFYGLVKAADEDLASAAGDHPELLAQLKEARAGYKAHMDRFGNDQILGLAGKDPSKAADYLFSSTEGVNALQKAVGDKGLNVLRRGVAHSVIDPVASSSNPGKALDYMISGKQEQFDRLFKPSQVDSLRDFAGARENLLNQTEEVDKPGMWPKLAGYFKKKVPGQDEVKLATDLAN